MGTWNGSQTNFSSAGWNGAVPSATEEAVFDGAVSNVACTIDLPTAQCLNLRIINNYSGTIIFTNSLTVRGNLLLSSTAFYSGTNGIIVEATAGAANITLTSNFNKPFTIRRLVVGTATYTFLTNGQVSDLIFSTAAGGNVTLLGTAITLSISRNLTMGGIMNGSSNLSYVLNGTCTWSGNNPLIGDLTIAGGTITVTSAVAPGSATDYVYLATGSISRTFRRTGGTVISGNGGTTAIAFSATNSTTWSFDTNNYALGNIRLWEGSNTASLSVILLSNFSANDVLINTNQYAVPSGAGNFTVNGDIPGRQFNIRGSLRQTSNPIVSGASQANAAKIRMVGSGSVQLDVHWNYDFEINTTGTITLTALLLRGNAFPTTFRHTTGTIAATGVINLGMNGVTIDNPGNGDFPEIRIDANSTNLGNVVTLLHNVRCKTLTFAYTGGNGMSINGPFEFILSGNLLRAGGTNSVLGNVTVRFTGGVGTATWAGGPYGLNFIIEKNVDVTGDMSFQGYTPSQPRIVSVLSGTVNPGTFTTSVLTQTDLTFNGMRFYNLALNNSIKINTNPITVLNRLTAVNGVIFGGDRGFTTAEFIHPGGGSTITLGITGTYIVTSNFQMTGTNGTAGRAVLQSNTRADFNGTVSANSLIYTSGTAPFIGGEVGMAQSYYNTSAEIPQGFAALLPGRPLVVSGATLTGFVINPAVNPGLAGNFSVGKKAKFFLLSGAAQNVIWAATQDIDSLGPGVYEPIQPQLSFNDSSGVTGPTLLRTLNWGTLAAPTRPAAFTFVT